MLHVGGPAQKTWLYQPYLGCWDVGLARLRAGRCWFRRARLSGHDLAGRPDQVPVAAVIVGGLAGGTQRISVAQVGVERP